MNRMHHWYCNREAWKRHVRDDLVPPAIAGLDLGDGSFSAAACFTMLHHVPSVAEQDQLFAEVLRVLRPGAPFAGTDSTGRGLGFAVLHIGDTKVSIDPDELAPRLVAAGFEQVEVRADRDWLRFRARRPQG